LVPLARALLARLIGNVIWQPCQLPPRVSLLQIDLKPPPVRVGQTKTARADGCGRQIRGGAETGQRV
jgi:hypothetical protein